MVDCRIIEKLPSAAEYNHLRALVGWGVYQEDVIDRFLPNSLYCVCAFMGAEIVGMARIIGDGGMVYYIQDVIVKPEYQRQSIGSQLMDKIMTYIRTHAHHNTIVGLLSAKGKESFYEKYGFISRPNDKLGCGMNIFWRQELPISTPREETGQ